MTINIAQQRAKHALQQIEDYVQANKEEPDKQKELLSYINSMGPMILMNGFGQTCAFYLASAKQEHRSALAMLKAWLETDSRVYAAKKNNPLIKNIIDSSAEDYQLAQIEALAYLDWLKRFAKAFLEVEDKTKGGHDATAS